MLQDLLLLADIDPQTAGRLAFVIQPLLSISVFLMLVRIVLTWYPNVKLDKLPWLVAVAPTEPFLGPTRRAVPPVGGVDVAPVRLPACNVSYCMHLPCICHDASRLEWYECGAAAPACLQISAVRVYLSLSCRCQWLHGADVCLPVCQLTR